MLAVCGKMARGPCVTEAHDPRVHVTHAVNGDKLAPNTVDAELTTVAAATSSAPPDVEEEDMSTSSDAGNYANVGSDATIGAPATTCDRSRS